MWPDQLRPTVRSASGEHARGQFREALGVRRRSCGAHLPARLVSRSWPALFRGYAFRSLASASGYHLDRVAVFGRCVLLPASSRSPLLPTRKARDRRGYGSLFIWFILTSII